MSVDPRELRLRAAREDNRNEAAARVRAEVRAEERGHRAADARWASCMDALQMTSGLPSDDFPGCVT